MEQKNEKQQQQQKKKSLIGEVLGVEYYTDGSVVRSREQELFPCVPAGEEEDVVSEDVVLDPSTGVWARFFLPKAAIQAGIKLPVVVDFHGGGFVCFSAATSFAHAKCVQVARKLNVLLVSVEYRLAPEHRLPTAFEDSFAALAWLAKSSQVKSSHGDLSRCFLLGCSAGATIVQQLAFRLHELDSSQLRVRGLILLVPFFGGVARASSEFKNGANGMLTLDHTDRFWDFSLPEGADRDHPFAAVPKASELSRCNMPPCLVAVGERDLLYDRQVEYIGELRAAGKDVKVMSFDRGHFLSFPEMEGSVEQTLEAYAEVKSFMEKCCCLDVAHAQNGHLQ